MKRLLAALFAVCAMPALAAPLAPASTPAPGSGAPDRQVDARDEAATTDRTCLRQTGTRIRYREGRCSAAIGRSWSRDDLLSTGRPDVVEALRALDPSIR
ncbi:hypothetical protein [Lysobacter humi (ex Lee et al. 2017)]